MFEGQPKGLFALALANTGERFGFYLNMFCINNIFEKDFYLYKIHNNLYLHIF